MREAGRVADPEPDVGNASRRWAEQEERDADFDGYGFSIGAHRRDEISERKAGRKVEIESEIAVGVGK